MSAENPFEHLSREDLIAICLENRQFREQIAREIEELPYYGSVKDAIENAAKIARGEHDPRWIAGKVRWTWP